MWSENTVEFSTAGGREIEIEHGVATFRHLLAGLGTKSSLST